jgi:hypothetical protein
VTGVIAAIAVIAIIGSGGTNVAVVAATPFQSIDTSIFGNCSIAPLLAI